MNRRPLISLLFASLCLIGLGFLLYSSTGRDDVFKTFWSAYALSEEGRILNYDGMSIEQSSSLLQVLLLGSLRAVFGGDVVVWGYWMSILLGGATVWMIYLLARQLGTDANRMKAIPWLTATCGFLVYWSFSGMETSLQAFTLAGLLWGLVKWLNNKGGDSANERANKGRFSALPVFIFLPLFLLCRPENPFLVTGILVGGIVLTYFLPIFRVRAGKPATTLIPVQALRTKMFILLGTTVVLTGLLIWYRYETFMGFYFPLPVHAKAGNWGWERIYNGLRYLFIQLKDHPDLILYTLAVLAGLWALVSTLFKKARSPYALTRHLFPKAMVGLALFTGVSAVVFSGGDWMENGRFLVPWLPLGYLLLPEGRRWRTFIIPVLIAVQVMGMVWIARHHSTGRPLWTALPPQNLGSFASTSERPFDENEFPWFVRANRIHARDMKMAHVVSEMTYIEWFLWRERCRVLSQQAGMVAYYTALWNNEFRRSNPCLDPWHRWDHLNFIDLVGLTTPDFHWCGRTADRGNGFGGLNMDLHYLIADQDSLKEHCNFEMPYLIFDLDNERRERQNALINYTVIYREEGYVETGDAFLPGLEVSRHQFVAKRQDGGGFPFPDDTSAYSPGALPTPGYVLDSVKTYMDSLIYQEAIIRDSLFAPDDSLIIGNVDDSAYAPLRPGHPREIQVKPDTNQ